MMSRQRSDNLTIIILSFNWKLCGEFAHGDGLHWITLMISIYCIFDCLI